MNVLYCGDRGIEDGLLISTLSLAKRLPASEPLQIYLLTFSYQNGARSYRPITEKFRAGLEKLLKKQRPKTKVLLFDLSEPFSNYPPTANIDSRFTPGCMLRLYADYIPKLPAKILYLDNDVVALKNPLEFYHKDLDPCELAGVLDNYGSHFFQRRRGEDKKYLNSGVLLLNMPKIRETKLLERARELCQKEKMFMPDQSALNRLCGSKLLVGRRFNEQGKTREDTVFRHFTTTFAPFPYPHPQTIKPWHIDALHRKLKEHRLDDILAVYQTKIKELKDE